MNDFKKKMKEKIKIYSKKEYFNGYITDEFMTEDGDADIYLTLSDKDELIDSRTSGKQIELTNEFYEFVENKSSILDNDTKLVLHINGLSLTSKERGMVKHIIKEHYGVELYKAQREYIDCKNKIIHLACFGVLTACIYFLILAYSNFSSVVGTEILGFLFSFSLWEACDAYIYTFSEIKDRRESITQNLLMSVKFENEKND